MVSLTERSVHRPGWVSRSHFGVGYSQPPILFSATAQDRAPSPSTAVHDSRLGATRSSSDQQCLSVVLRKTRTVFLLQPLLVARDCSDTNVRNSSFHPSFSPLEIYPQDFLLDGDNSPYRYVQIVQFPCQESLQAAFESRSQASSRKPNNTKEKIKAKERKGSTEHYETPPRWSR